ncbi:RWD domain-containing protein 4-like [Paramacrobiotus metropolitanus]|uniref:RWD domain-containing protein 4-like n=1 Tax=Paramacrobiotus metropolitanus TaxID=2943436 RepID=UPI002445AB10|nr:RWD domain-containing protein 4-like [Paramacrobiotus metropolitanus]
MDDAAALQSSQRAEEAEVLQSIYSGDAAFHSVDPSTYQLRVESSTEPAKRLLVQVHWPASYPDALPDISLDIFYNNHLSHASKERIRAQLLQEASTLLGCPMTYSLFEYVSQNVDSLLLAEDLQVARAPEREKEREKTVEAVVRAVEDKEHPRGWNWVDVIKHLSQTGSST